MFQTTNQSFSLWHFFSRDGMGSQTWVSKKSWSLYMTNLGDSRWFPRLSAGQVAGVVGFPALLWDCPRPTHLRLEKIVQPQWPPKWPQWPPGNLGGLFWWGGHVLWPRGTGLAWIWNCLKVWTEFHGFSAPWNGLSQSKIDLQFQRCYNDFFSTVDWLCIYSCHV